MGKQWFQSDEIGIDLFSTHECQVGLLRHPSSFANSRIKENLIENDAKQTPIQMHENGGYSEKTPSCQQLSGRPNSTCSPAPKPYGAQGNYAGH
jgi:hypothetical protein